MKKLKLNSLIKEFIKHPLFTGSFVMIIGSNGVNFLNYIYHLVMVKLLSPSTYGELAAVLSLIGLIGIIPASLGLVIIKFVSSSKSSDEISGIIKWFNLRLFLGSFLIFFIIILSSPFISSFLNIDNIVLIVLLGASFIFSLPSLLYKSVLQGVLRFKQTVMTLFLENGAKLVFGALLVYIGFSVLGAVLGFVIASFVGWALSRFFIRDFIKKISIKINVVPMFWFTIPVIIQTVSTTFLFTSDLILVKHFFSAHDAGVYAVISTLGKVILFGTGPIGAVMFPLVSQRKVRGENFQKIFILSLLLTTTVAIFILLLYYFFPNLVITILNASYLEASPYLFWYGVFITLFTISLLFVSLYLSLGKTLVVIFPLFASIFQILGIWFFHNSIMMVIGVSIVVTTLLLLSLFIYSLLQWSNKIWR